MTETYYQTKESVAEYIHLAKDVNGNEHIQTLKHFLPLKSTILELGSGPGTDWKILNESYDVTGSDFSKEFLKHLMAENPKGKFVQLDASDIASSSKFDAIYSNKVLHHMKDEDLEKSIKRQFEILNSNGIICHSFWKGEGSEVFKGLFVNYHTIDKLKVFFRELFDILSIELYEEFEKADSVLLIARKKKI